ncbi:polyketide cyclase [Leucobacter massiliensis]|uniref:Polyketide cyclase n=1 Tax=Leucobacter massiliensis TaxID=1686285 RepID=A0A2S9QRX6_9MICO|nr:polyketide cyclase [Leucobacter massiliensis]
MCLTESVTQEQRIVSVERLVQAEAASIFELIADPAQQPSWDGNDNLASAEPGQRVRRAGDVFVMHNTGGHIRENRVVEFEEGLRIAWKPSPVGGPAPGHLWRWELEPRPEGGTLVRHSYDWTELDDPSRFPRARSFDAAALRASLDRLAALAESR